MEIHDTPWRLDETNRQIGNVMKLANVNLLNIQLSQGEEVAEHDSAREVIIVVRSGEVLFTVEGTETIVTSSNILHMQPKERHSLRALTDADVLVFQITP